MGLCSVPDADPDPGHRQWFGLNEPEISVFFRA
jgi:hypothetical protein